ncbi:sugar phosphate isomerase/epimerase family protein [Tessaracoccus coleopterorum]|uniref:sugar phosphate isomerase/epimerase family protein n=1 Tax=Tessaracoccus coleopterorum TaxID=2714950 RepID=UPI002F91B9EC
MLSGLAPDADVSSDDPAVVKRGLELIEESIKITHELGGKVLTGALYGAFGKAKAPLSAKGRANIVASLKDAAQMAAELGVDLGLEVCNRYETNVINTAADALSLIDDIGAENMFIHLDVYHMNIEESDFSRPVRLVGDRLGYVHIGENHRGYLGSGHIDFGSFFSALADIRYEGAITFESFSSAVVMESLSSDLAIWRNLWDSGEALATHARSMMQGWIKASRV